MPPDGASRRWLDHATNSTLAVVQRLPYTVSYPALYRRISRPTVVPSPHFFASVALGTVVDNLDHGPERSPTPRTVLLRTLRYLVYGEVPWPVRREFAPVTRPATSALFEAPEPALDGAHGFIPSSLSCARRLRKASDIARSSRPSSVSGAAVSLQAT